MDARQRILHITFNMDIGGTEQVVSQLINCLDPDRFQNEIFCIDGVVGPIGQRLESEGIVIHRYARHNGLDWSLIRTLRQLITDRNISLIHCHQYTPFTYGWFASRFLSVPVVFTEHGRFHPDRLRKKAILLNPLMAITTSAITAISSATKVALTQYECMPGFKIQVVYNGIRGLVRDRNESARLKADLGIEADNLVVGTVARLDPVKNQVMMIRAFAQVVARLDNVTLLIVGDGPEREKLEQLVRTLGLSKQVRFTGFKPSPRHYLSMMDVFLLSSFTEGTSMTLLEAMSLGIPPVVTAVGGNTEIVENNVSALVTESDDEGAFATAVSLLLNSPSERSRIGKNALNQFNRCYSVERMVDQYDAIYTRLNRVRIGS